MQEKTKATINTSESWGNPNMKLPTPKMANHPTQLRNLSNTTKRWTLASIQPFHYVDMQFPIIFDLFEVLPTRIIFLGSHLNPKPNQPTFDY